MLVLARREGEGIDLNGQAKVTVKDVFGGTVALRIQSQSGISYAFRNRSEDVWVGKVRIVVARFGTGGLVYLGIKAPKEILILREELLGKTTEDTESTEAGP